MTLEKSGSVSATRAFHKYVVVFGSCCTADAIRTKNLEEVHGAKLRLLSYHGRTAPVSILTGNLKPDEFIYTEECGKAVGTNWGLSMVKDELEKQHYNRLVQIMSMSDALLMDTVSAFTFPYLITGSDNRCFLRSKEWERYVELRIRCGQKWLWEFPMELSVTALRTVLESLYAQQPNLRLLFHFPRPCFNDGVTFEDPQLTTNLDYYHRYNERLYDEAARAFPRVSVIACGGERADPLHYNYPFPFHYDESYMNALRLEIERLLA
jgi:hypothetical protein